MREMAFEIILDLLHQSPLRFDQVHSHINFMCKEEYDECIRDIAAYVVDKNHPLLPHEKVEHSDFLSDTQKNVYDEVLAKNKLSLSNIDDVCFC